MSQYMNPNGRFVVAERALLQKPQSANDLYHMMHSRITSQLDTYSSYWRRGDVLLFPQLPVDSPLSWISKTAIVDETGNAATPEQIKSSVWITVYQLFRNEKIFE